MLFDTITYVDGADHLYDIAGSTLSTPSVNDILVRFEAVRAFKLPASLAGTEANAGTDPVGTDAILQVKKNGTNITSATITLTTAGAVTLGASAETEFVAGDLLEIELTQVGSTSGPDDLAVTLKTLAT